MIIEKFYENIDAIQCKPLISRTFQQFDTLCHFVKGDTPASRSYQHIRKRPSKIAIFTNKDQVHITGEAPYTCKVISHFTRISTSHLADHLDTRVTNINNEITCVGEILNSTF